MKSNSKIQGIFFDLGGVLVRIDRYYENLLSKDCAIFNVPEKKLYRAIHLEVAQLEKGKETSVQFWRRVCSKLNIIAPPANVLRPLFAAPFKNYANIDARTLAIAKELRKRKYPVGIISNTNDDHAKVMRRWKLFQYFDPVILSNEVHTRKPERKIFMLASRKMGISPKQLLFIDDEAEWLRAARKCGFKTILFRSPAQLKRRLKKLKLLD